MEFRDRIDWAEYAEACFTHDHDEPVVAHAQELEQAACGS